MPIVQISITFAVGFVFSFLLIAIVFGFTQFAIKDSIDIRVRVAGSIAIIVLMSYLIGIIMVNALGGFSGLADLLR